MLGDPVRYAADMASVCPRYGMGDGSGVDFLYNGKFADSDVLMKIIDI